MDNAVIYTRVSTDEQVTNFSLDSQEKQCIQYASRQKINIIKVFREEGASAKTINGRPELLKLLKFCQDKKNQVTVVLVYKLDRWSRDTENGLAMIALLAKHGIQVTSVTEPSEDNAMGKAMRSFMLVWAQLDNDMRSERTSNGMRSALDSGYWPFRCPIGYEHIISGDRKIVKLISNYKPILQRLFQDASSGSFTKLELAEKMNRMGFENLYGAPATEKIVQNTIKNKFYYGIMCARKWSLEKPGNYETVTDEITWISANKRMFKYSLTQYSKDDDFPLRRFMLCGSCFKPLTGSFSSGNGGKYPYYCCAHKDCTNPQRMNRNELNELFLDYLDKFRLTEEQSKLLNYVLTKKLSQQQSLFETEVVRLKKELERLEAQRLSTVQANGKGLINDLEARQMLEDIRSKQVVTELELSENKIDKNKTESVINFTVNFLSDISKLWLRLDTIRKMRLQSSIFPEKVILENGKLRTNKISQSFELIRSFSEEKKPLVTPLGLEPKFLE